MNGLVRSKMKEALGCFLAAIALGLAYMSPALAQESSGTRTLDGVLAYYAIVPSEIVSKHPSGHPEAKMHGGVPSDARSHHLMVALFKGKDMQRITDAQVTATVAEVGLTGRTKSLDPFTVAGALTYGNYFDFSPRTLYHVTVTVHVPGRGTRTEFEFDYKVQ